MKSAQQFGLETPQDGPGLQDSLPDRSGEIDGEGQEKQSNYLPFAHFREKEKLRTLPIGECYISENKNTVHRYYDSSCDAIERDILRFCYTPSRTVLLSPIRLLCIFLASHLIFALASCMGTFYTTDGRDKREVKEKSSILTILTAFLDSLYLLIVIASTH